MLYHLTVPMFIKGLKNLTHILDKSAQFADVKKVDMEVLFNSRLAIDQFPMTRQIQIACDTAKLCGVRLTGKAAPAHPDNEKTLAEFKTRIASVISYLESLTPNDFEGAEKKLVTTQFWDGKHLEGEDYVHHHALPNFYFHITTTYSILRHNGVEIGKRDYLGQLPFKQ